MSNLALQIKNRISEVCSHFTFDYAGRACGVDPLSPSHFDMWYGDQDCIVHSVDEVMTTPLFGGKTLTEIADIIDIDAW